MNPRKSTKTWQTTRKPNLLRHKSGRYYGRAFAGGKEVWQSLKTSHYSVAEARLAEFLKEHRERRSNGNSEVSAKMTFCEALKIHQQNWELRRVPLIPEACALFERMRGERSGE